MESICEDTVVAEEKHGNFMPMLRSGEWSDIGHRPYMEDTHICIPDLARSFNSKLIGDESVSFYGVSSLFIYSKNTDVMSPVYKSLKLMIGFCFVGK
jgi:hypothetical protein